jgi:hypothetical protein
VAPDDHPPPLKLEPPNIRLDFTWPVAPAAARRRTWLWPAIGSVALAVCLALGFVVGRQFGAPDADEGPIGAGPGGAMTARGVLAAALEHQLASSQKASAPVAIGISFQANDGALCRTFVLRQPAEIAGLACRAGGAWRIRLATSRATPGDDTPAPVLEAVDQIIRGAPLDGPGERAARDLGWRAGAGRN